MIGEKTYWGPDLSGTEQGAGGVGGLLAVSLDGAFHLPCYDHNGNIVAYVSESGDLSAQYVYDPYGNLLAATGPLASQFAFGFSTKIHDREAGLISYQRRFYSPSLGRWLNRDPIEEDGGENLYAFCENNPISDYDLLGTKIIMHFDRRLNEVSISTSSHGSGRGLTRVESSGISISCVGCKLKVSGCPALW